MKKNIHRIVVPIFCCLCFFILFPIKTNAAVKLNHTNITLCRYHSCALKLKGTTKKVTWKSADKTVATVSKKGRVTAVTDGETTITACIGKKKYTCKVLVKDYDAETVLAAYGFQALKQIVPDSSTLKVSKIWLGTTVANIPFGMMDCEFEDKSGKKVHAYVYTYEQEEPSTSCYNVTTDYYDRGLVIKFDNQKMDSVQQTRVRKGSVAKVKAASKIIFTHEKLAINKGKNFNERYSWLKL